MAEVFQKGTTYFAPKGSYYEGNVKIDGDFVVPGTHTFLGAACCQREP